MCPDDPIADPNVEPTGGAPAAAAVGDPSPAAPPVASDPPVGDAPAAAPAAEPVDPAAGAEPPESASPAAKKDWRDRRIATLTAKLREAERAKAAPAADPAAPPAPANDDAEVNRRAAAMAAQNDFNRRCNDVAERGKTKFPDFKDRVANLQHLYTPENAAEVAAYTRLVEAALETDEPERVLYELGADMDRAESLMAMSPVKMGMEMAKLAAKKGDAEPSLAPKPITPVVRRGQVDEIDPGDAARADNLSTSTWIKRRQADIDKRRAAGERIF